MRFDDTYQLGPATLCVSSRRLRSRSHLAHCWQRFFHIQSLQSASESPPFASELIRLALADNSISLPPSAVKLVSNSPIQIWQTATGFVIEYKASRFRLDWNLARFDGVLTAEFWNSPLFEQREFFHALFFLLLWWRQGIYLLHANGVFSPRHGANASVLLVGASGAGKSTLALSLFQAGWNHLGDDTILLRAHADGQVDGHAFRRSLACTREVLAYWPELAALADTGIVLNRNKISLDIESHCPHRCVAVGQPRWLLFPKITGQSHTQLRPLTDSQTFMELINQSGSVVLRERSSAAALAVLYRRLVLQTQGFQIEVGTDVLTQPDRIAALLETALLDG